MRKKGSLVSINSSKLMNIHNDIGSQPVTTIITGGNSHDFEKNVMAKMDPVLKIYDPGYSGQ